ncbi:hypothetical protein TNCV_291621 [Trichonephila clavipes]|nr:hypothetical protein TNCV_291621 [Trichonephila clavipes]
MNAVHETTGCSPSQMLFGCDLRLLADLLLSQPTNSPLAPEWYIVKLQEWMEEEIHNLDREIIGMASEKMRLDTTQEQPARLPRRWKSVVMESETSQRTFSEAADELGRFLHSPKKTE